MFGPRLGHVWAICPTFVWAILGTLLGHLREIPTCLRPLWNHPPIWATFGQFLGGSHLGAIAGPLLGHFRGRLDPKLSWSARKTVNFTRSKEVSECRGCGSQSASVIMQLRSTRPRSMAQLESLGSTILGVPTLQGPRILSFVPSGLEIGEARWSPGKKRVGNPMCTQEPDGTMCCCGVSKKL